MSVYAPEELGSGTFAIRLEPKQGLIGFMYVPPQGKSREEYFVMLPEFAYPIPVNPGQTCCFTWDELPGVDSPETFYEAATKRLETTEVSLTHIHDLLIPWDPA